MPLEPIDRPVDLEFELDRSVFKHLFHVKQLQIFIKFITNAFSVFLVRLFKHLCDACLICPCRDDPDLVDMDTLYESPDEGEDFVGLKEVDLDDEYDL